MRIRTLAAAVAAVLLTGGVSAGQSWGPSGCPTVVGPVLAAARADVAVPRVECFQKSGDPASLWRFRVDGREVGTLCDRTGVFESADGHRWEFAGAKGCPDGCPGGCGPAAGALPDEPVANYGVDLSKLRAAPAAEYTIDGRPVDRRRAFRAMAAGADGLDDDSKKWFLTVVADDATRKRVEGDWAASADLARFKQFVHFKAYPAGHWDCERIGLTPGVWLQEADADRDGKAAAVWRFEQYPGPERLAEALRVADPSFDPKKVPDPSKVAPPKVEPQPAPAAPKVPASWLLIAAGAAVVWLLRKKS